MAEILAAFAAPPAVQVAYAALTFAWQQYQNVSGNKERCKVLIQRCQNLLIAVSDEIKREGLNSLVDNLHLLEKCVIKPPGLNRPLLTLLVSVCQSGT